MKKLTSILLLPIIVSGTAYSMHSSSYNDFLSFKENSIFCNYSECDFIDVNLRHFNEDDIYIHLISKSYYQFKYYVDELKVTLQKNITSNEIDNLINYIRNYKFDGTFKSITEILHLTVECVLCKIFGKIVDFKDLGFDIAKFKSGIISMTFEEFKQCMIDRLQRLL